MGYEELDSPEEIARFLDVKKSWIYSQTQKSAKNRMPFVRVGHRLRFRKSEVLQWLENQHNQKKRA